MTETLRRRLASSWPTVAVFVLLLMMQGAQAQLIPGMESGEKAEEEKPAQAIEVDEKLQPADEQIAARLQAIYLNLPSLQDITVEVNDGVIILTGTVDEMEAREQAAQLAERISGAVVVVNRIIRDRSVATRMRAAAQGIRTELKDLAGNTPLFLLALAVLISSLLLARGAGKAEWLYGRVSENWFVRDVAQQLVKLAIVFIGVIIALRLLDATAVLGSIVGALGIIGLAVGFATRDTVENYIASMLLSLRQPFRREDLVNIDGIEGRVIRLTPRATVLMSLDGNHVRIPNASVYKATIINYTRNPLRRFGFKVGVDTNLDLHQAQVLAIRTLEQVPGVLTRPAPVCTVDMLGDSSVVLQVFAWLDQRENDFLKVRSEAQRLVKEAFDDAGIVMPEPIYNVNLRRPHRKAGATADTATPAGPVKPSTKDVDTSHDSAVEEQIRIEQQEKPEADLLSGSAPVE